MGLLDQIIGGPQQQQDYTNFANRYDQGSPYDGISHEEATQRYQQVAPQLTPEQYQQAAQQTYERMSPQERMQTAQYMHQQAQQQGYTIPGMQQGQYEQYQDPNVLAQTTTQIHQQNPGMLGQLLGSVGAGGGGGLGSNTLAKVAFGGIAAMAVKNLMGGGL